MQILITYLFQIACATLAVAMGAPEAEAHYGVPALYNAYPNWPGVATPYYSSTCFGCRGKRSADADADAYYGYGYAAAVPYAAYGHGYHYGGPGIAGHPGAATSFVARSPQGLRGKRSAEAEAYYGYAAPFGYHYGPGIAAHPGYATSYVARSPQGLGKRSADAEADADAYYGGYGYAGYGHPGYAHSYTHVSRAHLGYGGYGHSAYGYSL